MSVTEILVEWFVVVPRADDSGLEDWYHADDEQHSRRLRDQFIASGANARRVKARLLKVTKTTEEIQ